MTIPLSDAPGTVTLQQKVAYLTAMPGVDRVIETHMAFVFLTTWSAFKLKKPVSFGYFDNRTIAARASACMQEVRLNRALAGDVYIKTIPLVQIGDRLMLGGDGRVIDWLVHMRRLPQDRMLDAVIAAKQGPTMAQVSAVMQHLTRFYRLQQKVPVPVGLYFDHLQREQQVNAAHLNDMAHLLPDPGLVRVANDLTDRLTKAQPDIAARQDAGFVVEGHGDLRPEHVCLTDPPVIFDRAEAATEMRVVDIFDEVGYLAAECAMLGRPDLGADMMTALQQAGFVPPAPPLLTTYTVFRLVTRARLALDHLRDPHPRTPSKWPVRAAQYLTTAERVCTTQPISVQTRD